MGSRAQRRLLVSGSILLVPVLVLGLLLATQERGAGASTVLTIFDGTVTVARGGADFSPASDGDLLSPGDRVQTLDDSHAVITFFDGSTMEMEPGTTVEIEETSSNADGDITLSVRQRIGLTWVSVRHLTRAKFQLHTPAGDATVRGTGFITEVLPDGATTVQTFDGVVEVTAQGRTVLVPAGYLTTALPSTPPTQPLPAPPPRNKLRFSVSAAAHLAVVDPVGRTCGLVLPGPMSVRQIPGCLVTEPGVEPQLVDLPNASGGEYQLVVFPAGGSGETYTVTAAAVSGDTITFEYAVSGTITGDRQGARLDVVMSPDGALSATGISSLSILVQSPLKVVLPSTAPAPSATGTPDLALFAPLPTVAPSPAASPALTPAPAPAPLPTTARTVAPTPTPIVVMSVPTAIPLPPPQSAVPMPSPTPSSFGPRGRSRTPKPHCPPPKCTSSISLADAIARSRLTLQIA